MTRLHPDDVKAIACQLAPLIVAELRRPVLASGGVPPAALSARELEERLRSEGRVHRAKRRTGSQ